MNRHQAVRRCAAAAAERSSICFIIEAAFGVEIVIKYIYGGMGDQQADGGENGVTRIKNLTEEPRFIPGNGRAEDTQYQRQDKKGNSNNCENTF